MYEIICCFTLVPDFAHSPSPLGHRMDPQRLVNTALAVFAAALVAQPLRSNIHDRWALLVATLLLLMRQIHRMTADAP